MEMEDAVKHKSTHLCPSCLKQSHLIIESEISEAGHLLGPADGGHQLSVVEVCQERQGEVARARRRVQAGQQGLGLAAGQAHQQLVLLQRDRPPRLVTRVRAVRGRGLHRIPEQIQSL